ncbi:MAG: histidine--tRNA ligase [Oscillospiraceae bacterium]|jgi:histidyl-tRNA synthetase|nr:histidine--tRNA ligase [Oscillospiraceae bacterium]
MLQRPYGTEDVTPKNINKWHFIENKIKETVNAFGFKEIRVPTFETPELFERSVGETTDVVQKEMYKVTAKNNSDNKGNEFTLRPEGTAGVIRAMIQNGMLNDALPQKVCYFVSCFRHERPQAGRLREFHQFGVELAGSASALSDAEVISLADEIIFNLQIEKVKLYINSIGCKECRKDYQKALVEYFSVYSDKLCSTCNERLEKNPMRLLDCKSPVCKDIAEKAPIILDYLCNDCKEHFEELKQHLDILHIKYTVNPKIVRGLDYYTRTVFEFVSENIGSQGTICGGGRYDGLIEELGGKSFPALGFGMGLERLIMVLENQKLLFPPLPTPEVYIANMGNNSLPKVIELTQRLRQTSHSAECDLMGRSLNAQLKYANKTGAKFIIIIGDNELETNTAKLKNLEIEKDKRYEIELGDNFIRDFERYTDSCLKSINELAQRLGFSLED